MPFLSEKDRVTKGSIGLDLTVQPFFCNYLCEISPLLTSIIVGGGEMRRYPTRKLIEETKAIVQLALFLRYEVGLKVDLSARDLRSLLHALKQPKKGLI